MDARVTLRHAVAAAAAPATAPAPAHLEVVPEEVGERLARLRLVPPHDAEMAASLRRYGQLSPLTVFRDAQGQLEVVDGLRRLRAAAHQGHPARLAVQVLKLDEVRALAALVALHRGRAGLTELEESWVVQALVRTHGLGQQQAAQLLRRHPSWVSRRLLLVEALVGEVQDDVRLGLCPPTAAREVARLPRGTQAACAKLIARLGLGTRQTTTLVAVALRRSARTAAELEAAYQAAGAETAHAPRDGYAADLTLLTRLALRLRRRLCEHPPRRLPPAQAVPVVAELRSALPLLTSLTECFTRALEEESP